MCLRSSVVLCGCLFFSLVVEVSAQDPPPGSGGWQHTYEIEDENQDLQDEADCLFGTLSQDHPNFVAIGLLYIELCDAVDASRAHHLECVTDGQASAAAIIAGNLELASQLESQALAHYRDQIWDFDDGGRLMDDMWDLANDMTPSVSINEGTKVVRKLFQETIVN